MADSILRLSIAGGLLTAASILIIYLWRRRRRRRQQDPLKRHTSWRERFSGLQWRMTFSYVWITIASILVLFALLTTVSLFLTKPEPIANDVALVQTIAQRYASRVAQQAQGLPLGQHFPYPLGEQPQNNTSYYVDAYTLNLLLSDQAVPYLSTRYPDSQLVSFALLLAPDMHILSSSYPPRYPIGASAAQLLPTQTQHLQDALNGKAYSTSNDTIIYATASVRGKNGQQIGAIYVQVPLTTLHSNDIWPQVRSSLIGSIALTLVLLILLPPLGGIFGFITTRGLVKRLKKLALGTTLVADGHYQHRLSAKGKDELGRLEQQFNRMAEQLGKSTARQKELAEQNARMAERSRIARELHDAILQDLFSLSMLAGGLQSALPVDSPLQHQANTLELTTNNTIREMHALLLELRPTNLEHLSLDKALAELSTAYSTRLGIDVKTAFASIELDTRIEHALLRITQEALANAARHANASEITLSLISYDQTVELCIRDNGQGFNTEDESLHHGLGLTLMQERVAELHGTLKLESSSCMGTALEIRLPLEKRI